MGQDGAYLAQFLLSKRYKVYGSYRPNSYYKNNRLKVKKILCKQNDKKNQFFYKDVNYKLRFNKNYIKKKDIGLSNNICTKAIFEDTTNSKEYQKEIDHNLFDNREKKEKKYFNNFFVEKNNFLYLKLDETIIDKNLYIPKNLKVIIKPNQTIRLINNLYIITII